MQHAHAIASQGERTHSPPVARTARSEVVGMEVDVLDAAAHGVRACGLLAAGLLLASP